MSESLDNLVCDVHADCLPGAMIADVTNSLGSLVDSAGEESVVEVHVGTTNKGTYCRVVWEVKFKLLGRRESHEIQGRFF